MPHQQISVAPNSEGLLNAPYIRVVSDRDIPAILQLEEACWSPALRANEETLRERFQKDHISMGLYVEDQLVGLTSFCYTYFDPEVVDDLPSSFKEFSSRTKGSDCNAAFVYNLNIHPEHRGDKLTRDLIFTGVRRLEADNIRYLVGVGRCPSYNGSLETETEAIEPSIEFKTTIDKALRSGEIPKMKELLVDPVLRFYRRTLRCEFIKIAPEFLPGDLPSGNNGVYFYKTL